MPHKGYGWRSVAGASPSGIVLPPPPSGLGWQPLKIGAGGFLTGMDIASDGTMVCRTDTSGAYYWNPNLTNPGNGPGLPAGAWQQILTPNTNADFTYASQNGVYDIKIVPQATGTFYMLHNGHVYKTTNHGATWTHLTGFDTAIGAGFAAAWPSLGNIGGDPSNDGDRGCQGKICCDPQHANTVYVGTAGYDGVYVTHDGGTTWSRVPTVPNASGDVVNSIAIDGTSGTNASGYSNFIYCYSYAGNVYGSFDGGSTWQALTSSGAPVVSGAGQSGRCNGGIYWFCAGTTGSIPMVWKYTPGASPPTTGAWAVWANGSTMHGPSSLGANAHDIGFEPGTSRQVIAGAGGGNLLYDPAQTNAIDSTHFSNVSTTNVGMQAKDIPWLATTVPSFNGAILCGATFWDPLVANRIWDSGGVGIWHADNTVFDYTSGGGSGSQTWQSQSAGIEQLVATDVVAVPGGGPVVTINTDRSVLPTFDLTKYPSFWMVGFSAGVGGWSGDYASDLSCIVALASGGGIQGTGFALAPGFNSWNPYTGSLPNGGSNSGFVAGCIAATTKDNVLWAPPRSLGICYSANASGGSDTWTQITLPDGSTTWDSLSAFADVRNICADRVAPNTFYFWGPNNFYKSADGGATWALGNPTTPFTTAQGFGLGFRGTIKAVPGNQGHLFASQGFKAGVNNAFFRTTDAGNSWQTVANMTVVVGFGFGKIGAPGQTYPSIYVNGTYNGVSGVWRSDDNAVSWQPLSIGSAFPTIGVYVPPTIDFITALDGDMNVYGRCYIGMNGSGYWRYN